MSNEKTGNTATASRALKPTEKALFDRMTELYPHWVANQSWLMFGSPGA